MDSGRQLAVKKQIETRTATMQRLARTTSADSISLAMAQDELKDLERELKALVDDESDSPEPDAMVRVPLRPRPHLNSGAIALVEPDDPYLMV